MLLVLWPKNPSLFREISEGCPISNNPRPSRSLEAGQVVAAKESRASRCKSPIIASSDTQNLRFTPRVPAKYRPSQWEVVHTDHQEEYFSAYTHPIKPTNGALRGFNPTSNNCLLFLSRSNSKMCNIYVHGNYWI